jgi:hypothetical protein
MTQPNLILNESLNKFEMILGRNLEELKEEKRDGSLKEE